MIVTYTGIYLFKTSKEISIVSALNDGESLVLKEANDESVYQLQADKIRLQHDIDVVPMLLKETSKKDFDFEKM